MPYSSGVRRLRASHHRPRRLASFRRLSSSEIRRNQTRCSIRMIVEPERCENSAGWKDSCDSSAELRASCDNWAKKAPSDTRAMRRRDSLRQSSRRRRSLYRRGRSVR